MAISTYTDDLGDAICEALIDGKSLREICTPDDMPDRSTVMRWMAADPSFAAKCARAREMQADYMDDLIIETANACTSETAAADRVKISAYQWRASKLAPKRFGDKTTTEVVGPNGGPLQTADVSELSSLPREKREAVRLAIKAALDD